MKREAENLLLEKFTKEWAFNGVKKTNKKTCSKKTGLAIQRGKISLLLLQVQMKTPSFSTCRLLAAAWRLLKLFILPFQSHTSRLVFLCLVATSFQLATKKSRDELQLKMSTLVCQPLVSGGTLVSLNPICTFSFLQTSTKTISKLPPRSRSSSEDVDEKQRDLVPILNFSFTFEGGAKK